MKNDGVTETAAHAEVSKSAVERLVMCRDYSTCVGRGYATLRLAMPEEYSKEDIADLRAWLQLIDRQFARLEEKAT